MSEAVITAETSAAPTPAEIHEPTSFAEAMQSWTPEQRTHWDKTGEEPTPKIETPATPAKEPEKKEPEPKAEVQPDAGTGEDDQDHEPEYLGTPEQIKAQRKAFGRLRAERADLRAELKLLREQIASKPADTAPAPKAEVKPDALKEPEPPNIGDFEDAASYDKANRAFLKEMRAYERQLLKEELAAERAREKAAESDRATRSNWDSELKAGREAHSDFDKIALKEASLPMLGVFVGMKGAAEILYQLGQNPELADELIAATTIPGNFQTYKELAEAAEANPALARQLGKAEGIAEDAARRILAGLKKELGPKPITKTAAPAPGTRVAPNSSAGGDPLKDAYDNYDKTGDHKFLHEANRLENERERAARMRQ